MGVSASFETDCVLVASAAQSPERPAAGDGATNNAFSGAVDVKHMAACLFSLLVRLGSIERSLRSLIWRTHPMLANVQRVCFAQVSAFVGLKDPGFAGLVE